MNVSVELTLTPLKNFYKNEIKDFIVELRKSEFKLIETPLSTQIYGDFDMLMPFLNSIIKKHFMDSSASILHMKIVNSDRQDYVADF